MQFSVIVPAFRRFDALDETLDTLARCEPAPAEILVHLDQATPEAAARLQSRHPGVKLLQSKTPQGPGGARNLLLAAARCPWVVNFDDDARPVNRDFFRAMERAIQAFPRAAMLSVSNQPQDWARPLPHAIAVPSGYASVFNKEWFERAGGFVPLRFAYCMEEVDYGLRVHAAGGWIIHQPDIHVVHDMVERPDTREFQASALANIALFFFLRYPLMLWPLAAAQLLLRLLWLFRVCPAAILPGLASLPSHLWHHRHHRSALPAAKVLSWLHLQRNPVPVAPANA